MEAKLSKDGRTLTITLEFDSEGVPSASGKTQVHASTRGNRPIAINGRVYSLGVNVYSK